MKITTTRYVCDACKKDIEFRTDCKPGLIQMYSISLSSVTYSSIRSGGNFKIDQSPRHYHPTCYERAMEALGEDWRGLIDSRIGARRARE